MSLQPSTFQSLLNDLFWPHLQKFILVCFDDILIYNQMWADHLRHLSMTLMILLDNNLFAKKSKCHFGVSRVDYLGHVISSKGVVVDPSKIKSISEWSIPTTVKDVRGFLELARYYRKFIRSFGAIIASLNLLLTKDGFKWSTEAANAFVNLK